MDLGSSQCCKAGGEEACMETEEFQAGYKEKLSPQSSSGTEAQRGSLRTLEFQDPAE